MEDALWCGLLGVLPASDQLVLMTKIAAFSNAAREIAHVCPRCRTPITLVPEGDARKCPRCGFESRNINGILSFVGSEQINEWQAFFQARSTASDRDTSAANDYRLPLQHRYIIDGFRRVCAPLPEGPVLDAGCGNGLFWTAFSGQSNVLGVDYSLGMCALARARGMRVYHADVTALPFADGQFELIYSAEIIQCVDDLDRLIAELARVCRTGGRIVVSTLNRRSLLRRAVRQMRKLVARSGAPVHTPAIPRTAAEIVAVARASSLSVGSVSWLHFPSPLYRRTGGERYALETLASNMIVELVKSGPAPDRVH
jgi:SAM-dependent methyltransferase